jgi:hypothetical protein
MMKVLNIFSLLIWTGLKAWNLQFIYLFRKYIVTFFLWRIDFFFAPSDFEVELTLYLKNMTILNKNLS